MERYYGETGAAIGRRIPDEETGLNQATPIGSTAGCAMVMKPASIVEIELGRIRAALQEITEERDMLRKNLIELERDYRTCSENCGALEKKLRLIRAAID